MNLFAPHRFNGPLTDRSASPVRSWSALLLVALAAPALSACGDTGAGPDPATASHARPVQVAVAREQTLGQSLRLPGSLRSAQRARPAFLHAGYIAERTVALGSRVSTGEILATLHNPALQPGVLAAEAGVREAQEQLAQLERDTERLVELRARSLVSEDELERTRSRRDSAREVLASAQARLAEAREQFAEASLRAPFSGVVMDVHVEAGDFVSAGQPVLELADTSRLELRIELPAARAAAMGIGDAVDILRSRDGAQRPGRVREIGGALPGRTQPVIIELDPTDETWLPGEAVYAVINASTAPAVFVPLAAIVNPGTGTSRVYRVNDDRAEAIEIRSGLLVDGWVAVDGPLREGDQVVIAGQATLLDGEAVSILR